MQISAFLLERRNLQLPSYRFECVGLKGNLQKFPIQRAAVCTRKFMRFLQFLCLNFAAQSSSCQWFRQVCWASLFNSKIKQSHEEIILWFCRHGGAHRRFLCTLAGAIRGTFLPPLCPGAGRGRSLQVRRRGTRRTRGCRVHRGRGSYDVVGVFPPSPDRRCGTCRGAGQSRSGNHKFRGEILDFRRTLFGILLGSTPQC